MTIGHKCKQMNLLSPCPNCVREINAQRVVTLHVLWFKNALVTSHENLTTKEQNETVPLEPTHISLLQKITLINLADSDN